MPRWSASSCTTCSTFEPANTGHPTLTAIGPFADGMPTDGTNLVAAALDLAGSRGRTSRSTSASRTAAGSAAARPTRQRRCAGPASARVGRNSSGQVDSAPTSRSASSAGAPACRGIGEIVEPLPHVDRTVTLVVPPLQVSTPAVYRAWDELGDRSNRDGANDLETAALVVEPDLARWRDRIARPRSARRRRWPAAAPRGSSRAGTNTNWPTSPRSARAVVVTHTVDAGRATGPGT